MVYLIGGDAICNQLAQHLIFLVFGVALVVKDLRSHIVLRDHQVTVFVEVVSVRAEADLGFKLEEIPGHIHHHTISEELEGATHFG